MGNDKYKAFWISVKMHKISVMNYYEYGDFCLYIIYMYVYIYIKYTFTYVDIYLAVQ